MEGSKKNEIVIKKANDHWAFLEYIEAPMWVDLILEANSGGNDVDDEWFNESHPFHQWSASQLKSKFSHPGAEILTSEVVDSPEIPSSVSRSRGKHYKSQKWGGINLNFLLDKQQGPSKRCFQAGSSFGQQVKPKSTSNVGKPKRQLTAILGLTFQGNGRGKTKPMASCSNPVSNSRTSRSTITSVETQQQRKHKEVSSQPCDQKSRSSSIRSIRESCVTNKASRVSRVQLQQNCIEVSSKPRDQKSGSSSVRSANFRKTGFAKQASRAEIGGDSMQSRGRKSSSGKSSVGSCSNPDYEVKYVPKHQRGKITDTKDLGTLNLADKTKCNPPNISETSTILVDGAKPSNRNGCNVNFRKSAYHRTAKSLVQYQSIHSRAVLLGKVNKENSCTGANEKLGTRKVSSAAKGKENATKNVKVNQGLSNGGTLKNHKSTELNRLEKGETARSAAFTILGEDNNQHEAKNVTTSLARRIYLR